MAVEQGPFSAQIERAIAVLLLSTNVWTGGNTFNAINFPAGGSIPASTAHALYSPDGTSLYWNGSALGGGSGMVYPSAGLAVSTGAAWASSIANGTGWLHNNGAGTYAYSTPTATDVGATTVGAAFFSLTNPSAITFPRINADNSVSALSASSMRTALGLAIGSDVQAYNSNLTTINQGLTTTSNVAFNQLQLVAGLAIDGATAGTHGIQFATAGATPASTAHNLYSPDGTTLWFNGSQLASGGDVVGPASATDGGFAKFNGTTGKLIKNSAAFIAVGDGGTGLTGYTIGDILTATGAGTLGVTQAVATGRVLTSAGAGAVPVYSANPALSSVVFNGATSGTLTIKSAATAGTSTITFPGGTTDFSATGGASQVVKQTSAGGAFTVAQLAASDLSNGVNGTGAITLTDSVAFTTFVSSPLFRAASASQLDLSTNGQMLLKNSAASAGYLVDFSTDGIAFFKTRAGADTATVKANSITATGNVSDSVGTMASLRSGALSIASQTTGDVITAASSTQLGRVAPGTSGNVLTSNGSAWTSAAPAGGSLWTLIGTSSGTTNTSGAATNITTQAISGLTSKDILMIVVSYDDPGATLTTYSTTDSTDLGNIGVNGLPGTGMQYINVNGNSNTTYNVRRFYGSTTATAAVSVATAFTGSWTIALRSAGGGSSALHWQFWVYKLAGQ